MVNEAIKRHLEAHVTEYKAAAPAAKAAERSEIAERRDIIEARKLATTLDIMRLELDGMTGAEIKLAYSAVRRLSTDLPLAIMEIVVDGEAIEVPVWQE